MISQDIFFYITGVGMKNKLVIALLLCSSFGLVASGQGRKKRRLKMVKAHLLF